MGNLSEIGRRAARLSLQSSAELLSVDMRGDPEQGACSGGMPEEHTTELARRAGVSIMARNSGFTDKGKPVKLDQVNRALGAWVTPEEAEYMGGPSMTPAESANMKFDEGMELYRKNTREANANARRLFQEATNLNLLFARAYAQLAATYRQDWNYEWTADLPAAEQRAFELAQRSVKADPLLPYGHVQLAYLHLYKREYDQAEKEAQEAVRLSYLKNEGLAESYAVLAQVLTYGGEPGIAAALMEKAVALEPLAAALMERTPVQDLKAPVYFLRQLGQAYYVAGQVERYQKKDDSQAARYYQKAEGCLKRALVANPNHRPTRLTLVAVYMESGREPEARALFDEFPDMRPHITLSQRRPQAPYKDLWIRDLYIDALRRAGS